MQAQQQQFTDSGLKVLNSKNNPTSQSDYLNALEEIGVNENLVSVMSRNEEDREHYLDSCFYLGKSDIQGDGVFTCLKIDSGKYIARTLEGKRTDLGRYVNHSNQPNCEFIYADGCIVLQIISPIEQDQELTLDYRQSSGLTQKVNNALQIDKEIFIAKYRRWLVDLQDKLMKEPQIKIKVHHKFFKNYYVRTAIIPKGTFIMGKTHKKEMVDVCLYGDHTTMIDGHYIRLKTGDRFISSVGSKKTGYSHEDTAWTNIYQTKERDIKKLEAEIMLTNAEEKFLINKELKYLGVL